MLRKYVASIAIVCLLLMQGIIYPTAAVVTAVDYETGIVTVEKSTGFVYTFEGVEDLVVGDVMALVMYSNGTPTIEDDVIISARYSGYVIGDMQ